MKELRRQDVKRGSANFWSTVGKESDKLESKKKLQVFKDAFSTHIQRVFRAESRSIQSTRIFRIENLDPKRRLKALINTTNSKKSASFTS